MVSNLSDTVEVIFCVTIIAQASPHRHSLFN